LGTLIAIACIPVFVITDSIAATALGVLLLVAGIAVMAVAMRKMPSTIGLAQQRMNQLMEQSRPVAETAAGASICANCGTPMRFAAGEAAATCSACRATAVAPKALQEELSEQAEQQADQAQLAAEMASRQANRQSPQRYYWKRGSSHPYHKLLSNYARSRGLELHNADSHMTLDWLDRHWLAATPDYLKSSAVDYSRWHLVGSYGGVPLLLVVVWDSPSSRGEQLYLLLASPRLAQPQERPADQRGYSCELSLAGVLVKRPFVDEQTLAPESLDWLVDWARGLLRGGITPSTN